MYTPEQLKDSEDIKHEFPNGLKESIRTDFKKGEDLQKPLNSEPLQKNMDVIERENL